MLFSLFLLIEIYSKSVKRFKKINKMNDSHKLKTNKSKIYIKAK